ncbi:hypothetical protein C5167_008942 [Papaver somniferum]|uniref:Uncharacterized protein n=1 Tax=Papaver somniferum TaxID=3469 RepID=A0A4Y7JZW2_PAPSO|nr:hypothetical protein C5167_008942 [Papaver somniferum]
MADNYGSLMQSFSGVTGVLWRTQSLTSKLDTGMFLWRTTAASEAVQHQIKNVSEQGEAKPSHT